MRSWRKTDHGVTRMAAPEKYAPAGRIILLLYAPDSSQVPNAGPRPDLGDSEEICPICPEKDAELVGKNRTVAISLGRRTIIECDNLSTRRYSEADVISRWKGWKSGNRPESHNMRGGGAIRHRPTRGRPPEGPRNEGRRRERLRNRPFAPNKKESVDIMAGLPG